MTVENECTFILKTRFNPYALPREEFQGCPAQAKTRSVACDIFTVVNIAFERSYDPQNPRLSLAIERGNQDFLCTFKARISKSLKNALEKDLQQPKEEMYHRQVMSDILDMIAEFRKSMREQSSHEIPILPTAISVGAIHSPQMLSSVLEFFNGTPLNLEYLRPIFQFVISLPKKISTLMPQKISESEITKILNIVFYQHQLYKFEYFSKQINTYFSPIEKILFIFLSTFNLQLLLQGFKRETKFVELHGNVSLEERLKDLERQIKDIWCNMQREIANHSKPFVEEIFPNCNGVPYRLEDSHEFKHLEMRINREWSIIHYPMQNVCDAILKEIIASRGIPESLYPVPSLRAISLQQRFSSSKVRPSVVEANSFELCSPMDTNFNHVPDDILISVITLLAREWAQAMRSNPSAAETKMQDLLSIKHVSRKFWHLSQKTLGISREVMMWKWIKENFPGELVFILESFHDQNLSFVGWLPLDQLDLPLEKPAVQPLIQYISIPDFGQECIVEPNRPIELVVNHLKIPSMIHPFTLMQTPFLHTLPLHLFQKAKVLVGIDTQKRPFLCMPCEYTLRYPEAILTTEGVMVLQRVTPAKADKEIWVLINSVPFKKEKTQDKHYFSRSQDLYLHIFNFAKYSNGSTTILQKHFAWLQGLLQGKQSEWLGQDTEDNSPELSKITVQLRR